MKIGFLVNDVDTEHPSAATTVMAHAAASLGHDVYYMGAGELTYDSEKGIRAAGRLAPPGAGVEQAEWLTRVKSDEAERLPVAASELDVLYLRYNPGEDPEHRPWEPDAGIVFGQAAVLAGTLVLSHPFTLSYAVNKMYLEHFPEEVRPRTIITRSYEEIARFHEQQNGKIVVKPVRGYGGKDVYLVNEDAANLRQIVEALARASYIIAQEFLPAASEGDTRLFLFNGKPLVHEGRYAAVKRVNESGDFRSNMSLGGKPHRAEITPRMLEIAEAVRPRLVADGLFDVGLDIVGDKLVEINPISAGGLNAASRLEGVKFGEMVIRLIERKVAYRARYGHQLRNRALAVME
jgi:glutathione synthase